MTNSIEDYRRALAAIEDALVQSEDIDGFQFAAFVREGETTSYQATIATHPDAGGHDVTGTLGYLITYLATTVDTHPAVLAHEAVKRGMELSEGPGGGGDE